MDSVFQTEEECFVCRSPYTDTHHILYGIRNRQKSEDMGYKVYLCRKPHNEVQAHPNHGLDLHLKILAQKHYEKTHTREDFIDEFGESYIWRQGEEE